MPSRRRTHSGVLRPPRHRTGTAVFTAVFTAVLAAVLGTAGAVGGGSAAAAPATGSPGSTSAGATTDSTTDTNTGANTGATRRITLLTGEVATVRSGPGGPAVAVRNRSGSGPATGLLTLRRRGHLYAVPRTAASYVDDLLDLALFDLGPGSRTAADRHVVLTYRSGRPHRAIPGITRTGGSGDTVAGTVTDPKAFGHALAAQYAADHEDRRGSGRARSSGPLADLAHVAPATGATPPPVHPDLPMHTVTLKAVDRTGKPGFAYVELTDMEDHDRYDRLVELDEDGLAEVSVPAGHYAGLAQFTGAHDAIYLVTRPSLTVSGSATFTFDARTATSRFAVTTPRPATPEAVTADIGFLDRRDRYSALDLTLAGDEPLWYTPAARPAVGDLYQTTTAVLRSAASVSPGYDYTLGYASRHVIPADQSHATPANRLARVDAAYRSDGGTHQGFDEVTWGFRWGGIAATADFDLTTPAQRTNYYNTEPGFRASRAWGTVKEPAGYGVYASGWRGYRPGQHLATTWGASPRHPRLFEHTTAPGPTVCAACLDGRTARLLVYPFGDDDPEHAGYGNARADDAIEQRHYTVTADGRTVASKPGSLQGSFELPAGAKTYGFTLDTTRRSPGLFRLSDRNRTTWTVPATSTTALPKGWACNDDATTRTCRVLPLLTNSYHLPVDPHGALASGATTAGLDLGHLARGDGQVADVTFEVSYDDGKTWQRASVTGGSGGHYGLGFTVPSKGSTDGYGAIRLTAKDAAGSTLTQTVHRAFAVR